MSLTGRSPIRRCGCRFKTQAAAARSKRALNGNATPVECPLHRGFWRLETVKQPAVVTFSPKVAAQIDKRDCRRCQDCGSRRGLHRHHRRGKAAGGSRNRAHAHCACNGILLCHDCHRCAHDEQRAQAEADGFIVSQSVDQPATVAVARFARTGRPVRQVPTCDGEWATEGRVAA